MRDKRREYYKQLVALAASQSTADREQVGALIVKDDRVISTGYNGQLPNEPHEKIMCDGHDISTIHAEANALMFCAKHGIATDGCEMVVTHSPCQLCSKLIVQAGITKVYYIKDYRKDENPFLDKLDVEKL